MGVAKWPLEGQQERQVAWFLTQSSFHSITPVISRSSLLPMHHRYLRENPADLNEGCRAGPQWFCFLCMTVCMWALT
jgi:hypothetical protein